MRAVLDTNVFISVFVIPGSQGGLNVLGDAPDNRILACAIEGRTDIVVTGNRHLLRLKTFEGIPLVRARECWSRSLRSQRGARLR